MQPPVNAIAESLRHLLGAGSMFRLRVNLPDGPVSAILVVPSGEKSAFGLPVYSWASLRSCSACFRRWSRKLCWQHPRHSSRSLPAWPCCASCREHSGRHSKSSSLWVRSAHSW